MEKEYKLVQKYNIDIDVLTDTKDGEFIEKLPDCGLSKELLSLYFSGKLDKVWKFRNINNTYWARAKDGSCIYSDYCDITEEEIKELMKKRRGGYREGAGRKAKNGLCTTTMRVPTVLKDKIECLIEMYANWINHDDVNDYEYRTKEKERWETIDYMKYIIKLEEQAMEARRKKAMEAKANEVKSEPFDNVTEYADYSFPYSALSTTTCSCSSTCIKKK